MSEHQLDASGLLCPEPVMLLHQAVRKMQAGDEIMLTATDPSTERDIPKFCHYLGHDLLEHSADSGVYRYRIRKQ